MEMKQCNLQMVLLTGSDFAVIVFSTPIAFGYVEGGNGSDGGDGSDGGGVEGAGVTQRVVYWHRQFIVASAITQIRVGGVHGDSNAGEPGYIARCTEYQGTVTTFG